MKLSQLENNRVITSREVSGAPVPSPGKVRKEESSLTLLFPCLLPGVDNAGGILPEVDLEKMLRNSN